MLDSMYNGVSGILTYEKALNSESNNIANVNTTAYKSDVVSFADMLYQNNIGSGVSVTDVSKNFNQGSLKITGNSYDVAISGPGFFSVQNDANEIFYTRAGNFHMGTGGTLQTVDGLTVMGVASEAPIVIATDPAVTMFTDDFTKFLSSMAVSTNEATTTINAKATDYESSAVTSGVSGTNYKTADAKISDIQALIAEYNLKLSQYKANIIDGTTSVAQTSQVNFDTTSINDATDILSITIDGNQYSQKFDTNYATTLNNLADQLSSIKGLTSSVDTTTGILDIQSLIPGKEFSITQSAINQLEMQNNTTVQSVLGTGMAAVTSVSQALKTAIESANGKFLEITNKVTMPVNGTATLGAMQLNLTTLNLSDTQFANFTVEDGNIYMNQDGNVFVVGKLTTSIFRDNLALRPEGNNVYSQTVTSGESILTNNSKIINNTLEISNSNLSEGLVNLMVYQKAFEANSKSITTSDELLKTAIQLKK